MKDLARELLRSKKFLGLLAGLLATGAAYVGLEPELASSLSEKVLGLVASYVVGQGLADVGKEAAKVEAS